MAQKPLGSVLLNPIDYAASWHYVVIAGMRSPGAIAIDGLRGFERETGWDIKKGKGTKGATLSLTAQPPAEGSIEFQLWDREHFLEWVAFRKLLKYNPSKAPAASLAFDMYYPPLADLDMNTFVTKKIGPAVHKGKGLYTVTIDFIEWLPPPPVSIVKTPTKAAATNPDDTAGSPPDPVADAQQAQIAQLMKQAGLSANP